MQEDDVEQMTMSFVAFSENRVSNHLIANYIIYLLLKHREPRIVEVRKLSLFSLDNLIVGDHLYSVKHGCYSILVIVLVS